jgi:hypothetical protein
VNSTAWSPGADIVAVNLCADIDAIVDTNLRA